MKKNTYTILTGVLVLATGVYGFSFFLRNSPRDEKADLVTVNNQESEKPFPKTAETKLSSKDSVETISHNKHNREQTASNSFNSVNKNIFYTNRVVIVTFHDMSEKISSTWNMSPQLFGADLQALNENHFHVITNSQFADWLDHRGTVPPNAVLLTFDDGYKSMYTRALPILLKYHMTGTFFDIVFRQDTHSRVFMSWSDLNMMVHDGMSVESHTYDSHFEVKVNGKMVPVFDTPIAVNGKKETAHQYFIRDYKDFFKARYELQIHLGGYVNEFAYPYGWGTRTPLTALKEAGYHFIFTTTPGDVTPRTNPDAIPRIDIGYSSTLPEQAIQDILQAAGVHTKQPGVV